MLRLSSRLVPNVTEAWVAADPSWTGAPRPHIQTPDMSRFTDSQYWSSIGTTNQGEKPVKITRKDVLIAIITYVVLFLGTHLTEAGQDSPPLSSAQIIEILSSSDRTTADRTNDLRRKPEQMLGFIGIRPGIVAVDLSAGGGYTTELLARAIGPLGKVYGQSRPRDPNRAPTPPVTPEGNSNPVSTPSAAPAAPASTPRPSPVALAERENNLRSNGVQAAPIVALSRSFGPSSR